MSSELLLMMLADARLPVAGHTQSAGLEPALRAGLPADEVPRYIAARLRTVTLVEAGTAVVALHALRQGLPLEPVETAWAARTVSPAMRDTSRSMARALLRLVDRLWPDHPAVGAVREVSRPSRGLAWAAAAAATGLAPRAIATVIGYDDVQTVASAALKLAPLDPMVSTGWVLAGLPAVEAMAAAVAPLTDPDDIPSSGSPQIEEWAEAHARSTRRLFNA